MLTRPLFIAAQVALIATITLSTHRAAAQEPVPAAADPQPPAAAPPPVANSSESGDAASAFGHTGQIVLGADLPLGTTSSQVSLVHQSYSMSAGSGTTLTLAPSADYFIVPNVSLGGGVAIAYQSFSPGGGGASSSLVVFGLQARAGINIPLTPALSLWPRGGLGYGHGSTSSNGTDVSSSAIDFFVFAPVVWHPATHFFVGLGPVLATELTSSVSAGGASADQPKLTSLGLQSMIGGYFGGV